MLTIEALRLLGALVVCAVVLTLGLVLCLLTAASNADDAMEAEVRASYEAIARDRTIADLEHALTLSAPNRKVLR